MDSMKMVALSALIGLLTSWWLTGSVRRYALAKFILDVPNERSSHSVPTPRGGGLAIAATVLVAAAALGFGGIIPRNLVIAFIGGGGLIAGIGWIDDRRGISAQLRALTHVIGAGWAIYWIGGFPYLSLGATHLYLGLAGSLLAIITTVWFTNLYNFMDGIDGIAGIEALSVGLIGGILLLSAGSIDLAVISLLIAAASAGFLIWNWCPAKIFMGDVGSGLLGFLFAILAITSARLGAVPLLVWIILLGVFAFDATVTLLRRAIRGERWYAAHRSHAYQRAVQAGFSHAQVSGIVFGINLMLGLLATAGYLWPAYLLPNLFVGLGLLTWIYLRVEYLQPMMRST